MERDQLAWRWVWLTLATSIGVGVALTMLLWGHTPADHRNAFDVGWRSAAAVLAIFATFLAVSRVQLSQREHHRQVAADNATRQDAMSRQITELATKASDQLGVDNPATRIGGLAALERLAQTYPELRQTVVDQICSYLRRPFQPPPKRARTLAWDTTAPDVPEAGRQDTVLDDRLELDVRRSAQEILRRHLVWPAAIPDRPETFWDGIAVDLRDAVLVDLDLGSAERTSSTSATPICTGPRRSPNSSPTRSQGSTGHDSVGTPPSEVRRSTSERSSRTPSSAVTRNSMRRLSAATLPSRRRPSSGVRVSGEDTIFSAVAAYITAM